MSVVKGRMMTADQDQQEDVHSRLTVVNRSLQRMMFVVEPWGSAFWMEPREKFEVVAQGPPSGALQLQVGAENIVVLGWPGSFVAVYRDGERLDAPDDSEPIRVPLCPR